MTMPSALIINGIQFSRADRSIPLLRGKVPIDKWKDYVPDGYTPCFEQVAPEATIIPLFLAENNTGVYCTCGRCKGSILPFLIRK